MEELANFFFRGTSPRRKRKQTLFSEVSILDNPLNPKLDCHFARARESSTEPLFCSRHFPNRIPKANVLLTRVGTTDFRTQPNAQQLCSGKKVRPHGDRYLIWPFQRTHGFQCNDLRQSISYRTQPSWFFSWVWLALIAPLVFFWTFCISSSTFRSNLVWRMRSCSVTCWTFKVSMNGARISCDVMWYDMMVLYDIVNWYCYAYHSILHRTLSPFSAIWKKGTNYLPD